MTVMIIIGILSAFGLPYYKTLLEKNIPKEAEANLVALYNAEKKLKLATGQYFACAPSCTKDNISQNLSVEINDKYFSYSISSADTSSLFQATATRRDGICKDKTIYVNQSESFPLKECETWQD